MMKIAVSFAAAALLSLVDSGARACDKDKRGHEAKGPDARDARVLAKGDPVEVAGAVTCSTCEEHKPGPCSLTLKDAAGKSYVLTWNKTTRAIHEKAAHQGSVEVRGRTATENGMAYLAPISFRVVTASEATLTAPAGKEASAKGDAPKKSEGCCSH